MDTAMIEEPKLICQERPSDLLKGINAQYNTLSQSLLDPSASLLNSLINKMQTPSQASPSFRLNASANINTDNISKLLNQNPLNQLKTSLLLFANKGLMGQMEAPGLQNTANASSILNMPQKLASCEDPFGLNLTSLYANNTNNLFNLYGYPSLIGGSEHFLHGISQLQTQLNEQTLKGLPLFGHSMFNQLNVPERKEVSSRIIDENVDLKKF